MYTFIIPTGIVLDLEVGAMTDISGFPAVTSLPNPTSMTSLGLAFPCAGHISSPRTPMKELWKSYVFFDDR
jgi:hypothetical protein